MNFFGSPEEHFHGRDYFKIHSGNTELGETPLLPPAKNKPNPLDNSRNPEATHACSQIMN